MSLKEQTIKEIQQLSPHSLALIYNHIQLLKKKEEAAREPCKRKAPYLKVRKILSRSKNSLSGEIVESREDRL